MRKIDRNTNLFEYTDKIILIYLRKILRRLRKIKTSGEGLLGFDDITALGSVKSAYEEITEMTVEALKLIARRTYKYILPEIPDEDIMMLIDPWLSDYLAEANPVTQYFFYPEADRKRARLYESLIAVTTATARKKEIEKAARVWSKQLIQFADNVTVQAAMKAYQDAGVKYVMWVTRKDDRVCPDCHARSGKIYPISTAPAQPLHYNCRCWYMSASKP